LALVGRGDLSISISTLPSWSCRTQQIQLDTVGEDAFAARSMRPLAGRIIIALVLEERATSLPRRRGREIPEIRRPVAGVEALGAAAADKKREPAAQEGHSGRAAHPRARTSLHHLGNHGAGRTVRAATMAAVDRAHSYGCGAAVRPSFAVAGLTLRALEWGASGRPALCFLHGGSAHAHWFDAVAPAFAGRHHVLSVDQRGHSPILPRDMAAEMARRIPRAKVVEIAGAYHHLVLDRPEAFTRELEAFLAEAGR
jgi:hypothetical protein